MAQLNPDFVNRMSAFGSSFYFDGANYRTLWVNVRGSVCKRRNYKQDWIMLDMWLEDEDAAVNTAPSVSVGSDAWIAAMQDTAFDAFFGDRVRIGELGAFQFADDYRPSLPQQMVEEQLFRYLEQLERKPEYQGNDVWHEMFFDIFKQYEFYREKNLKESIFFYHWARDCDLCESEGVEIFSDWFEAADWIHGFGESAEGPQSLYQMTYEQWRVFNAAPVRDRALEQFEEHGYGY